jgi:hypothetical protein
MTKNNTPTPPSQRELRNSRKKPAHLQQYETSTKKTTSKASSSGTCALVHPTLTQTLFIHAPPYRQTTQITSPTHTQTFSHFFK